ncbi:MAG: hypothetical protein AB8B56_05490 [Crocinitomicaceae bacterium]
MSDDLDLSVFFWSFLIGAILIALPIFFMKWRNTSVKLKATELLYSIGFNKGNVHHDYLKTESQYIITLNHIPKEELFQHHRLRIGVHFEIPWEYDVIADSLARIQKEYGDYGWDIGHVYYDVYYFVINKETAMRIDFRVDETLAILKKHGLNPISFEDAQEQYLAIEKWRSTIN